MKVAIALMAGLAAAATIPHAARAQAAGAAKIEVKQKAPYGKYLTDASGRALYLFTADASGNSSCYEACAQAWPPLTSGGHPVAGTGLQSGKLSTVARKDGTQQVTYGGAPLYRFVRDHGPGTVAGEEVKGFGGTWYLVSPSGGKIEGD